MTSVVLWRTVDVPPIDAMRSPRLSFLWVFVNDDLCVGWRQRRSIVVERAVELRFGGEACVYMRLSQEIDRRRGLFYQTAPEVQGVTVDRSCITLQQSGL